ncbi:hypothetical protein BX600DRAFT_430842 [Xylariales sp. PMI_506]|nr:hypothetical protein BX600DRAFT_430842 [Xylariales sp. PMI_506]
MAEVRKSAFLALPPEIREHIYRYILDPADSRLLQPDEYTDYDYSDALVLFKINQQIYYEARKVFRDLNVFVKIQTPFPNAREYVSFEGHVPILMKEERAARFTGHSLSVVIEAPQTPMQDVAPHHFVVLLDDLEKFTRIWLYSDLSNPGLNRFLNLRLELRDPYTPEWEDKRMPKWKQVALLMPFGVIKDLRGMTVGGNPKPLASVEADLRAEQAVPHASAEKCLAEATRFKEEGNKELTAGRYLAALKLYEKSWEAMHIVVKGRQRHVHAEAYFARNLVEEPFKGKHGPAERLKLRIQLVANTCQVYLKMEDWEELCFWGMRTIQMLQQATGAHMHDIAPEDEALMDFPAAVQIGKIYYRTGMAYKALCEKTQARKLLRVAAVYLPHDNHIKLALAQCAPRIL